MGSVRIIVFLILGIFIPLAVYASDRVVYFVRHGESQWSEFMIGKGNFDLPLSSKGISQAKVTANILKLYVAKDSKILSSTSLRALQTCQTFCREFSCEFQIDSRLMERNFDPKKPETEEEFENRIKSFVKYGLDSSGVVFAHGLVFQKLQMLLGISKPEKLEMGGIARLSQSINGSWKVQIIH